MLATGTVTIAEVVEAFRDLWRPFVGVAAIMVTAGAAEKAGILERVAALIERGTRGSVGQAYLVVFSLSALTATLFNNDAAVLLLTPAVVTLVKRRYPVRPYLVIPFAFAVFLAAGVAPFVISNPMNMVVAGRAGIGFNAYAARMVPIWLAGSIVGFVVLRRLFHAQVDDPIPGRGPLSAPPPPPAPAEWRMVALLAAILGAYPLVSYLGGPVWAVAAIGAGLAMVLAAVDRVATPKELLGTVAWEILLFLFAVFVIAIGLRNAGIVGHMVWVYTSVSPGSDGLQIAYVGITSALGSAILNNHPMAILNSLAIEQLPGAEPRHVLAALIGGDLGPRLLPIGSLAGLLWMRQLRRAHVTVSLRQFVRVGAGVTLPTLIVSLAILLLMG